ncbi:MAG: hypothetical protein QOH31_2710, partial [Verrucomicrobiota bacterium]
DSVAGTWFSKTNGAVLDLHFAILAEDNGSLACRRVLNSEQFFRKSSATFPRFKPYFGRSDASEAAETGKKPGACLTRIFLRVTRVTY